MRETKATIMDPGETIQQAESLTQQGQRKEALALLQQVLAQAPDFEPAHDLVFRALADPTRNLDLVEFYRDLLKVHPEHVGLTLNLARAYGQGGKDSLAVLQIQKVLKTERPDPRAYAELARTYGRMNKIRMALEAINSAIGVDPSLGMAHRERVRILASCGEREEAAIHAVHSLSTPGLDAETRQWLELADAALEAGQNLPDWLVHNGRTTG